MQAVLQPQAAEKKQSDGRNCAKTCQMTTMSAVQKKNHPHMSGYFLEDVPSTSIPHYVDFLAGQSERVDLAGDESPYRKLRILGHVTEKIFIFSTIKTDKKLFSMSVRLRRYRTPKQFSVRFRSSTLSAFRQVFRRQ
jgi:hypothetical protein